MLKINDYLTTAEREQVLSRSDLWAWWLVLSTWALTIGLLSVAGALPHPVTILLVWVLLAGRQLGLSVLMHEAGHNTLFASRALNHWVGQWLCALPTLNDLTAYATGHLDHPRLAGTPDDPDLRNYRAYPVDDKSFLRKVVRDLTGQTGFKLIAGILRGGLVHFGGQSSDGKSLLLKQVLVQAALAMILIRLGIGWTWWLWFASLLTSYMLVARFRQIAEHAAVPDADNTDPRFNTRTVEAPVWQRFLMAPHFVNYHLEHHLLPGVPCYRLPGFRALLKEKGLLDEVPSFNGYQKVLRHTVQWG
jgi:fatty acid desaturase